MGASVRPNGMSSSAAALRYWEHRQEVTSNNLANVSTDGFKSQKVFARMVEGSLPAADESTDFSQGSLQVTNNPRDIALEGNGFFVVKTPTGERYSRGGSIRIDDSGNLTDSSGHQMLGENGPIKVTSRANGDASQIRIAKDGTVTVDKAEVGRLRVETIADKTSLQSEGAGLFIPPSTRNRADPDSNLVRQGSLEQSNVSAISQMVDMISIQRAYAAVQKAVTTLDTVRQIATTELARPSN
ncbi:MAG: flagellar hook-basal body protein [Gemmatimonadota bacterium]|nr:flagellar hook-basal body protein [Gemmatimonadota bacterium]